MVPPEQRMTVIESRMTFLKRVFLALAFIATLAGAPHLAAQGQPPQKSQPSPSPSPEQKQVFDDRAATRLLMQLTQGLEDNNQKQVLAVFDFVHMQHGQRLEVCGSAATQVFLHGFQPMKTRPMWPAADDADPEGRETLRGDAVEPVCEI